MIKYISLLILLTSCIQEPTIEINNSMILQSSTFKDLVKNDIQQIYDEQKLLGEELKKQAELDCRKTAKCVGKSTYLKFDAENYRGWTCFLKENDKAVNCGE